ncbi:polysaccharide biosynthesis PFTS motif protein [Alphaproteobacteria bacterium]|nr:polysaccharide biosynthesis PFTS motif protein [Alphaproteobacteria bacterium]
MYSFPPLHIRKSGAKRQIRKLIRAARELRVAGKDNQVEIVLSELKYKTEHPSIRFQGISLDSSFVSRYVAYKLFSDFLRASIQIEAQSRLDHQTFPLPKYLLTKLTELGFKPKTLWSNISWRLIALLNCMYTILYAFRYFARFHDRSTIGRPDLYLHNLQQNNFCDCCIDESELQTVTNFFLERLDINYICIQSNCIGVTTTSKKLIFAHTPIDHLDASGRLKLLAFAVSLFFAGIWDTLFGKGVFALCSQELLLKRGAMLLKDNCIAKQYGFHNSFFVHRPAWVDVVTKRGATAFLYFYSMNCLPFRIDGRNHSWHYNYTNLPWEKYLVWNKRFGEEILRQSQPGSSFEAIGPIPFSDKPIKIEASKDSIAVFDITPARPSIFCKHGMQNNYYTSETTSKFILQLVEVAEALGQHLVIKHKRSKSIGVDKKYKKALQLIEKNSLVTIVDPDISAFRLMDHCKAAVSQAFTSTAHIAKHKSKPSIYFDPTGRLSKNQPAALGVDIIQTNEELKIWMKSLG